MADGEILTVANSWAGIQRVATIPKTEEFFKGRKGYQATFLGDEAKVALPSLAGLPQGDIAPLSDGSFVLKYEHFSTVQCISRRMSFFSACNIDGSRTVSVPRHDTWSYDGRIKTEYQLLRNPYGPQQEKKFSRGHMTRRQDPNWGSRETAQRANIDTFFATNACPQWQPFNDGLWGDLEDYILGNADGDDKKISVITGPIFSDDDPERFEVRVPRDFWKVVAFVSQATGQLAAIGYVMSQGKYLDSGVAADLEDFEMSQRPISYIEERTGLKFEDLQGRDVLDGADITFVQPIRHLHDTKLPVEA